MIPLCSANVRDSSVSALTRPRCSSSSGRSSCAILRTSSSAWRIASLASSTRRPTAVGIRLRERVELEQDAGQHLADLVVEAAGDPQPLGFLRRERAAAALATLGLEPVEHLVEGADDFHDLDSAPLGQSLPRLEQVDRSHPLDEPVDWSERRPKQQQVGGEHHHQNDDEVERLDDRDRARGSVPGTARARASRRASSPALIAKTRQSSGSREKPIAQDSRVQF